MSQWQPAERYVDLLFPASGSTIPTDHGYALYAAVSRIIPTVHLARDLGLFSIKGIPSAGKMLTLNGASVLRVRVPVGRVPALLPMAGEAIDIDGHRVRIGVPRVQALVPATALASSLVLIKIAHMPEAGGVTPELFLAAARKQLIAPPQPDQNINGLGLSDAIEIAVMPVRRGPRAGKPRRRVIRVKGQTHVGYAVVVQGLTAEESIRLQETGLGGRRLMGCGLFLPVGSGADVR